MAICFPPLSADMTTKKLIPARVRLTGNALGYQHFRWLNGAEGSFGASRLSLRCDLPNWMARMITSAHPEKSNTICHCPSCMGPSILISVTAAIADYV